MSRDLPRSVRRHRRLPVGRAWRPLLVLVVLASSGGPPPAAAAGPEPLRTVHRWTDESATIGVAGLARPVTVLQLTDSHITVATPGDDPHRDHAARMDTAYGRPRPDYRTKELALPADRFRQQLALARREKADLVALTGDTVNNPSAASVEFVAAALRDAGVPSLYVAGNHDWHYEGLPGTADELRAEWTVKRLQPLDGGRPWRCAAVPVGDLTFVLIDNSTYQVDAQQLAFFDLQVAGGRPLVLLVHIPLWLPQNSGPHVGQCGDPRWGWDADRNFAIERRQRWPATGNLPSTVEFVTRVRQAPNLVAVLAGHLHQSRVDQLSGPARQYVTRAGCDGGYRLVRLEPLPADRR